MSIFPFTSRSAIAVQCTEILRLQSGSDGATRQRAIYRLAKQFDLAGEVRSEGPETVVIASGPRAAVDQLVEALRSQFPALAPSSAIARRPYSGESVFADFAWAVAADGAAGAAMFPASLVDGALCAKCAQEIFDPASRYYRYPFTSCRCCGPRLSIAQALPYERSRTSLAAFPLCTSCQQAYETPTSRRYQASALACPVCGPQVQLVATGSRSLSDLLGSGDPLTPAETASGTTQPQAIDDIEAARTLLLQGELVAIKGLGSFYLACDATHEGAVRRLRQHLGGQPLTLMAPNSAVVERYCRVSPAEKALLESPMAPVVLLEPKRAHLPGFWLEAEFLSFHRGDFVDQIPADWQTDSRWGQGQAQTRQPSDGSASKAPGAAATTAADGSDASAEAPPCRTASTDESHLPRPVAPSVALRQYRLRVMLPQLALHHLMLQSLDRPIVYTPLPLGQGLPLSNQVALTQLAGLVDFALLHTLEGGYRLDDSVVQVAAGRARLLLRGRGYVPGPIPLPEGFGQAPPLLAMGGQQKNTFCLIHQDQAILSSPIAHLEGKVALAAYRNALRLLGGLQRLPAAVAVDQQTNYPSTRLGLSANLVRILALDHAAHSTPPSPLKVQAIQHHHAHVAACMAENGLALRSPPVLGIVFDSLGLGDDGTFWGGEFLLADYRGYRRLAALKPVALLGQEQAVHQPWRSIYAQLRAAFDWSELTAACGDLGLMAFLADKPQIILEQGLKQPEKAPLHSSAEQLFDAVAAALGICREAVAYPGQGVAELEALIELEHLGQEMAYPFELTQRYEDGLWLIEPRSMWLSLLADLMQNVDPAAISARFHRGLANAIATLTHTLQGQHPFQQVVLTGGVFQNQVLALEVKDRLSALGLTVLTHSKVPPNDGGLSLGQAVIAAARHLTPNPPNRKS